MVPQPLGHWPTPPDWPRLVPRREDYRPVSYARPRGDRQSQNRGEASADYHWSKTFSGGFAGGVGPRRDPVAERDASGWWCWGRRNSVLAPNRDGGGAI